MQDSKIEEEKFMRKNAHYEKQKDPDDKITRETLIGTTSELTTGIVYLQTGISQDQKKNKAAAHNIMQDRN